MRCPCNLQCKWEIRHLYLHRYVAGRDNEALQGLKFKQCSALGETFFLAFAHRDELSEYSLKTHLVLSLGAVVRYIQTRTLVILIRFPSITTHTNPQGRAQVHPEKNPGNADAREAFEHLNAAHKVLKHSGKLADEKLKQLDAAKVRRAHAEATATIDERVLLNARRGVEVRGYA